VRDEGWIVDQFLVWPWIRIDDEDHTRQNDDAHASTNPEDILHIPISCGFTLTSASCHCLDLFQVWADRQLWSRILNVLALLVPAQGEALRAAVGVRAAALAAGAAPPRRL